MLGVYVLDLDNGHLFVSYADSVQEAEASLLTMNVSAKFDGSYHYYPMLEGEEDKVGEIRIFMMLAKKNGLQNMLARPEVLASIGKGTWCPDMEIRKFLHISSSESFQPSSTEHEVENEKELFTISI